MFEEIGSEIYSLAQDRTTSTWWRQDWNPSLAGSKAPALDSCSQCSLRLYHLDLAPSFLVTLLSFLLPDRLQGFSSPGP